MYFRRLLLRTDRRNRKELANPYSTEDGHLLDGDDCALKCNVD